MTPSEGKGLKGIVYNICIYIYIRSVMIVQP